MKKINIYKSLHYAADIEAQVIAIDVEHVWRNRLRPVWGATEEYNRPTIRQISEELESHENN